MNEKEGPVMQKVQIVGGRAGRLLPWMLHWKGSIKAMSCVI